MFAQAESRPYGKLASNQYPLTFDLTDETQIKAKKGAQQLMAQRGVLKQLLIGVLAVIRDLQEITGKPVDVADIIMKFRFVVLNGTTLPMPQITEATRPDDLPGPWAGS